MKIDWAKHHRLMPREGWCGPTTVWMILSACGIKKSIGKIAKAIWIKWYGTPPQLMAAYLSKYFDSVGYEEEATVEDILEHLAKERIVIVNWMDGAEGHYSIVYKAWKERLGMVDSSRDERSWLWNIAFDDFTKLWYDYLTDDKKFRHDGILIWVDPESIKGEYR